MLRTKGVETANRYSDKYDGKKFPELFKIIATRIQAKVKTGMDQKYSLPCKCSKSMKMSSKN